MADIVEFSSDQPRFAFSARFPPLATLAPGTRVRIRTNDAPYATMSGDAIDRGAVNFQKVNALIGPIAIDGAVPGDAVGFAIEAIELGDRAFVVYPARWRAQTFGKAASVVEPLPVALGEACLPNGGKIAVAPMIGCIGVAPSGEPMAGLGPTGVTGGNMDLVEMRPGATIWFPAQVAGGLLSLGDLHARMGRGEAVAAGLESAGVVTGRLLLRSAAATAGPIVVTREAISFVGSDPNERTEAERIAVAAAWMWLRGDPGPDDTTALAICAALLDVNMGGPAGAIVVATFNLDELRQAGVDVERWPVVGSELAG